MPVRPAIIPCLRYDDAPAAILFLCDAFGFLPSAIHADEEDQRIIHHAQLMLDGNMIMLSSARDDEAGDLYGWTSPEEAAGVTMTLYVVIGDPDAHHAAAVAAGAGIVTPPRDNEGYPGRGYTARDPEGQVWSFGSYDPFAPPPGDG
ncbi:MAG TPA: VOC family protein [Sphingomonas sp.]